MNNYHQQNYSCDPVAIVKGTVTGFARKGDQGKVSKLKQAMDTYNKRGQEVADSLNKYALPNEQAQAIVDYAIYLMTTQPQMKIARVIRKTVEHFKLQLKDA